MTPLYNTEGRMISKDAIATLKGVTLSSSGVDSFTKEVEKALTLIEEENYKVTSVVQGYNYSGNLFYFILENSDVNDRKDDRTCDNGKSFNAWCYALNVDEPLFSEFGYVGLDRTEEREGRKMIEGLKPHESPFSVYTDSSPSRKEDIVR